MKSPALELVMKTRAQACYARLCHKFIMTSTLIVFFSRDKSAVRFVRKEKRLIMSGKVIILMTTIAALFLLSIYTFGSKQEGKTRLFLRYIFRYLRSCARKCNPQSKNQFSFKNIVKNFHCSRRQNKKDRTAAKSGVMCIIKRIVGQFQFLFTLMQKLNSFMLPWFPLHTAVTMAAYNYCGPIVCVQF